MSTNESTLHFLSLEDPQAAIRDPSLKALLSDGWEIRSNVLVERMGRHELCLILMRSHAGSFNIGWKACCGAVALLTVSQILSHLILNVVG